ncbi:mating-type protein A-alpha Y4 [Schizophyllum commune]
MVAIDALKGILATSHSITRLAQARGAPPLPARPSVPPLESLFEPLPQLNAEPLRQRLLQGGIPQRVAREAISLYESAVSRCKTDLETNFNAAAQHVSPHALALLNRVRHNEYYKAVTRWAGMLEEMVRSWKAEMAKQRGHIMAGVKDTPSPKRKFHSEYTPLLEFYFHFNAYPTYADRRILAEKTGMLTRQITVWFQNHRRRSQGPLPRMSPTAKIPLEEFEREREKMARKLLPVLLPSKSRALASGNENKSAAAAPKQSAAKSSKNTKRLADQVKTQKAPRKASENAKSGLSSLGAMLAMDLHADRANKKKSKKDKTSQQNVTRDVEMRDATATKEKRRKIKKLPRVAGQPLDVPMDVDKVSKKALKKAKKSSSAFDSKAELAYAQAAYPSPSKYAYVHARKPPTQQKSLADPPRKGFGQLGKGRPSSNPVSSTVPPHRVSSRLNAMRPPYAFPAPYNAAVVPLTFSTAQTTRFEFVTDSRSFGFSERTLKNATVPVAHALIDYLISKLAGLRLLCGEDASLRGTSMSTSENSRLAGLRVEGLTAGEASGVRTHADSYAARRAITYVPPSAPLDCAVRNLARALQLKQVWPMVLAQPVEQPDAFGPFIALAERRARRRERKQKKALEEKQAKKERKERKKAARSQRDSLSMDVDVQSRASSVASNGSLPSHKSKKSRKSTGESAASSRATSVASSARTPSLSSTSSRRSSGMSMPGTPRPEQDLPVMAAANFDLAGGEDITMTPDLMAQLFGDDENDAAALGQMQQEDFSPDMLTFSSTAGGALSDMTADVNMPDLGNVYTSQQSVDDMGWAESFGLDAQNYAPLGSFEDQSNAGLDWLLSHNLLGDNQMSDLSYTAPTSQINILGGTYTCELGGSDNPTTSFNMNDWTFGLGACDDGFAGFGHNLLGGTAVAV